MCDRSSSQNLISSNTHETMTKNYIPGTQIEIPMPWSDLYTVGEYDIGEVSLISDGLFNTLFDKFRP